MKKFSNLDSTPTPVKVNERELAVTRLIEALTVQVDGAPTPWAKDITLVQGDNFTQALTDLVNIAFKEEKKSLLERARQTAFTQDAAWADEALDALNESNR